MSAIADALQLLEDEISAFAFLPAVNYFYLFLKKTEPNATFIGLCIFSLLTSAFAYNILVNVNFSSYSNRRERSQTSDSLSGANLFVPLGVAAMWFILLFISMVDLVELIGGATIWPELLVAITLLIFFLTISDILLDIVLTAYAEENSDKAGGND